MARIRTSKAASRTAREAASILQEGASYSGLVTARRADGTYDVKLDAPRKTLAGVYLASTPLGGLLGFNFRQVLSTKTKVMLVYGSPSFIYATIQPPQIFKNKGRTATGKKTEAQDSNGAPIDMIAGEFEISNMFGMTMQFLTNLMKMSAGDRASVECHLINDMVRIISGQFRHISPLGEELMFDHGRPTLERSWTSYRHELFNKLKSSDPLSPMKGDEMDVDADSRIKEVGRHRLLEFIGFAGDFIHSFVTDPSAAAMQLTAEATDSAGKSWIHRNSDGSILIQSVADISIERVCRVVVPFRVAHHESREAALERNYEALNSEFLKGFNNGSELAKHAYRNTHQLRAYARWLSRFHSLARVAQLDKDYDIKSEAEAAVPSYGNLEEDREKVTQLYVDAYACIRIMRDGSVSVLDAYGSSFSMSNGNVHVAAARHLDLDAAGDIRMTAGNNIFMKAKRHIEIVASEGGLILSGYAFLRALAEAGTLWLRSTADTESETPPAPASEGAPTPDIVQSGDEKHAVLIEANLGRILYRSRNRQTFAVDSSDADNGAADIVFNSKTGDIAMRSRDFCQYIGRNVRQSISGIIASTCQRIYMDTKEFCTANVRMAGGKVEAIGIKTRAIESNTIRANEMGQQSIPGARQTVPKHNNHILSRPDSSPVPLDLGTDTDALVLLNVVKVAERTPVDLVTWLTDAQGPQWSYLQPSEYYWDAREETPGAMIESMSQQQIRIEVTGNDRWAGGGYETWTPREIPSGSRVGFTASFGVEAKHYTSNTGETLHLPSPTQIGSLPTSADWTIVDRTFRILKRPQP